jgi:hypothetical protein
MPCSYSASFCEKAFGHSNYDRFAKENSGAAATMCGRVLYRCYKIAIGFK